MYTGETYITESSEVLVFWPYHSWDNKTVAFDHGGLESI
jgi:hypothetical protein